MDWRNFKMQYLKIQFPNLNFSKNQNKLNKIDEFIQLLDYKIT